jgi:hypothetical protein
MADASESQDNSKPQPVSNESSGTPASEIKPQAADNSAVSTVAVLDWALKLSAEERGWIDQTYQPPQEVTDLTDRLLRSTRSFYVLTGLWGVGKSSALQFIFDALSKASKRDEPYLLRLAPDTPILDQIVANHVRNPTEYVHDLIEHLEVRHKLEHRDDDRFSKALDTLRLRGDLSEGETVIPKSTLNRIKQKSAIDALGEKDSVLLDLPDFSKTDRRPLIRVLNQIQDLWLKVMKEGAEYSDEPIGPNFVITLQKELFDVAPSYFLGKANIVELKPLTAEQLIDAYRAKFPICGAVDEPALDYLAHLSRGVFRRFLKFLAVLLRDTERRKLGPINLSGAMAAVSPTQVSQEMEGELAYIFPKPEQREKGAKIIMTFLQRKYQPSRLQQISDPNLANLPGEISQKQLAEMLSLTEVDVSRLLDRLEANGLMRREHVTYVDEDGRLRTKVHLHLNL